MYYGYARCSTKDKQNIERQVRELLAFGADEVLQECASGTIVRRPELDEILTNIKKGDTLAATEVSRLTRSVPHMCEILELAENKQIRLVCGSIIADYTTAVSPMYRAMLLIMAVFAELERGLTVERVKSGLKSAKADGTKLGRPKKTIEDVPDNVLELLPSYRAGDFSKVEFAKRAGISRHALYKYLRLIDAGDVHPGQVKKTAEDIPPNILVLLQEYEAGKLRKSEVATLAGISRPTLNKYLALLGHGCK
jgi:DNA invertase Pin-like site-specific DNA recombinase